MKKISIAALVVIIALCGCGRKEQQDTAGGTLTDLSVPERALTPDSTWEIVFNSYRDGNYEIYAMNLDGSDPVNLTRNDAADWVYDADSLLIFASNRGADYPEGYYDLYVMDREGANLRQITQFPVCDSYLSASPDGGRYAVCSDKDGNMDIYVVDSLGKEQARLTQSPFDESDPDWSPGGKLIAFRSNRSGPYAIWIMGADGSNPVQVTQYAENEKYQGREGEGPPRWSPDGSRILFFSMRDGDWDIYTIRPDGTELTNLSQTESNETWPSWSPDGTRIAFCSDRDGNFEIYVMSADGTDQQRLTDHPESDQGPLWVW